MRILAAIDQSIYAQSVIEHAAWVAAQSGAEIDLLHVISPAEMQARSLAVAGPVVAGGAPFLAQELAHGNREEIDDARIKAEVQFTEARTTLAARGLTLARARIVEGDLPQIIAAENDTADLVIIGKRGENADLARLPLGSNVERVVRASSNPVLVVPRTFRDISRCLVAFDSDSSSAASVDTLVSAGLVKPMPCTLLHVGPADDELQGLLSAAADKLQGAGFEVHTELADGDPERVIPVRVVEDNIDLVIMGAFGRSRIKTLIFGSLTSEVTRGCQTPLLLCS